MLWTVHIEGGPRRVNHAATSIGDKVYSFGGYCTGDNYQDLSPIDVFVLNTTTLRWKALPKPEKDDSRGKFWPFQRYGHTVSPYKGKIYLFGGRNDETACNTLYCFDPVTQTWSVPKVYGDPPSPRDGHSACIVGDELYIFSGFISHLNRFMPDIYKLDFRTMRWKYLDCLGTIPMGRDFHTATAVDDKVVVFGGRSGSLEFYTSDEVYPDKVYYLDTKTLTWHAPAFPSSSPRPSGRRSHADINLNGNLLIFGGYNGLTKKHMDDMWILDTSLWKWTQISPSGNPPIARRRCVICRVGNQIFLFGGTSPNYGPPIFFTQEQISQMPQQEHSQVGKMIDHDDLHVLDLSPTLRTLCMVTVIKDKEKFDLSKLPKDILFDLDCMTKHNTLSRPLPRLPLG